MSTERRGREVRNGGWRPLDRLGSLKIKLGVLIVVTVTVATVLAATGVSLGWLPGYTIPLAVISALLVTQVLARGLTSPIRDMTAAARAMARGDYGRRVPASSRDEVGELARAFNTMADQLAAVEQQRRDLVANVSHELRTPISALHAVLENVVDGVSPADPATLRTALAQTERLGRLVTDLLDLSRVEAGIVPLQVEPVALGPLLEATAAESTVAAPGVRVAVEVRPDGLTVSADRARLHQLLANLVDNATRHSPVGGQVLLRAAATPGGVVLDVLDEGPGIPTDQRKEVFERFARGASADGGTGLGLAIARWVTQLHGGRIQIADSDRGCDIRVHLPDRTGVPT